MKGRALFIQGNNRDKFPLITFGPRGIHLRAIRDEMSKMPV
jgi:hypothetical protein